MNKLDNRNRIIEEIKRFIKVENAKCRMNSYETHGETGSKGIWKEPLVGFADVHSEFIKGLRKIAHPQHQMPEEVIPGAKTVVAYFVPFEEWVATSQVSGEHNKPKEQTNLSSPQWAESYELTNAMFARLNAHIVETINSMGYEAAEASEAGVFYRDEVNSRWSFRHLAYAAGLGTFGLNNMLITEKGCCGRYNAIVTNLDLEPDVPKKEEACLYKKDGSCGVCMARCPVRALSQIGFDRHKCYEQCLKNAEIYKSFGSSYGDGDENHGSEVCGKCIAGMPCAHKIPR